MAIFITVSRLTECEFYNFFNYFFLTLYFYLTVLLYLDTFLVQISYLFLDIKNIVEHNTVNMYTKHIDLVYLHTLVMGNWDKSFKINGTYVSFSGYISLLDIFVWNMVSAEANVLKNKQNIYLKNVFFKGTKHKYRGFFVQSKIVLFLLLFLLCKPQI